MIFDFELINCHSQTDLAICNFICAPELINSSLSGQDANMSHHIINIT
jgi:hypothetical protein